MDKTSFRDLEGMPVKYFYLHTVPPKERWLEYLVSVISELQV